MVALTVPLVSLGGPTITKQNGLFFQARVGEEGHQDAGMGQDGR